MRHPFAHLKIWHLAAVLLILCLLALSYFFRRSPQATPGGSVLNNMTAFTGGTYEASGVTDVPGTDGVLFVDNGRPGQVFWMRLDGNGKQAGQISAVGLGVGVEDIEGITTDGKYFYVVSSQAKPKAANKEGLVRFKFNAQSLSVEGVESIIGLKRFLLENVAELREEGGKKKAKHGGLNIEGLAWDPRRERLLVGLRSPIIDEHALLVPLKLRDPRGPLSVDNLRVDDPQLIELPLGGSGIRGIEYDGRRNVFRLLAGASEDQEQTDFGLWEWNGDDSQPALHESARFDGSMKPEGVARVTVGGRDFTLVVFDAGGYTVME
ncbi:MAG: DUF3616 domain-containing protein [Pyrinomonadaceae bacterium]